jgi:hypothetical protein
VATNKGCLNCHELYGERGKVASDLSAAPGLDTPAGVLSALWNHSFIADPRTEREKTPGRRSVVKTWQTLSPTSDRSTG